MNNTITNNKFLYIQVMDYLKNLIKENYHVENYKLPSETQLSEMFNVSRITVKKAIYELQNEGLVYSRQGKGTFINNIEQNELLEEKINGDVKLVGLILPDFKSTYVLAIMESVEEYLKQYNYSLLIAASNYSQENEKKIISNFLRNNVAGIIIYPVDGELYNEDIVKLAINKYPLVFIDRKLAGLDVCYVHSDNFEATYKAVSYLIKEGHQNIGLISTNPHNTTTIEERVHGYKTALKDNNITINSDHIFTDLSNYDKDWKTKIEQFIINNNEMTALFATNFDLGIKVHLILEQLGNKKDIDVIYYDYFDETIIPLFNRKHIYIKQNLQSLGKNAAKLIVDLINNKIIKEREIVIPSQLVSN